MATFGWPIILILNAVIIILVAIFVIWTVQKKRKQDIQCKMNEHQIFKAKQHSAPIT